MNQQLLTMLSSERRRAVEADFACGDTLGIGLRQIAARSLRAIGEGLFRLGVALDGRVPDVPVAETRNA